MYVPDDVESNVVSNLTVSLPWHAKKGELGIVKAAARQCACSHTRK